MTINIRMYDTSSSEMYIESKGYGFFPHGQYVDTVTGHGGQGPG